MLEQVVSHRPDQAFGLRRMAAGQAPRVIAVTSGKGGVGKTNVSVNLAVALSALGRRVVLLDADLGLGNADVLLGLYPRLNLSHVLDGQCSLEDVMVSGPGGIRLVPAASGLARMTDLTDFEHGGLVRAFGELGSDLDVMLVDTAAGASSQVTGLVRACQEIVVVVCDEPASITDAYALMKLLHREHGCDRFRVLASMTRTPNEGRELFIKLVRAADRFLSVSLDYIGCIPFDERVRDAVRKQRAVLEVHPHSPAARAFKELASMTDKWPVPDAASGRLEFFVERLVQASHGPMEVSA